MAGQKPSIPKGTRDFSPVEMVKRNFIFDTIKAVFKQYGYLPIETPAMENLSSLLGKYGDEGDKLLFKILNSGDFLSNFTDKEKLKKIFSDFLNKYNTNKNKNIDKSLAFDKSIKYISGKNKLLSLYLESKKDTLIKKIDSKQDPVNYFIRYLSSNIINNKVESSDFTYDISEKGLRYDLTVPFARYVVQHLNDITFPFKRYQIQPVWRADRPQKGRYREFYQCDVDVIGSNSLLNEAELIQIIDKVFQKLNINTVIKLNNRKILLGIAEVIGAKDKFIDLTVALDKLDKIGLDGVKEELEEKGFSESQVEGIYELILVINQNNSQKLTFLKKMLIESKIGLQGTEEIETVLNYFDFLPLNTTLELDLTLARGLNYYTGAIIEVKALDVEMGSICGGGRYDDLTGVFGLKDVSGVGVSFGADRIYDVMEQLQIFPEEIVSSTKVMFVNFGKKEEKYCLPLLQKLRDKGISAEMFPESAKMKKQMAYANNKNIPYVILVGENEMNKNLLSVKNMISGEQTEMSFDMLLQTLQNI